MQRLRVGFIGCGGIAQAHAARLSSMNEVELVAFSDVQLDQAKAMAAKLSLIHI